MKNDIEKFKIEYQLTKDKIFKYFQLKRLFSGQKLS